MHQKKHSGKPHNSPYLPEVGKCISEACKAVQPFNCVSKHATHLWLKKKWKEKCSKGKEQIKYICLCNSTLSLSVIMCPLYFVYIQRKVLRVYFLFRTLQITLWKHPSVSLGSVPRNHDKLTMWHSQKWLLFAAWQNHSKSQFRIINLFALFSQFYEVKLLWMQWLNLANNEQRWYWL